MEGVGWGVFLCCRMSCTVVQYLDLKQFSEPVIYELGYNLDHVHIVMWAGASMKFGKKFENVHVLNLHFFD